MRRKAIPVLARARGFTLLEAIVTIVLLGILFAMGLPVLSGTFGAFDAAKGSLETLSELRYALERMAREIRVVRRNPSAPDEYHITSTITNPSTNLVFYKYDTDGTTPIRVTIDLSGSDVTMAYDTLSGGSAFTLTDQASALAFNFYQADGATAATGTDDVAYIQVDLTVQNPAGTAYRERTWVALRNRE